MPVRMRFLSGMALLQCCALVNRDVIGLVALDFVLRVVSTRMMGVSPVFDVTCMNLGDLDADMARLGVPGHAIANFAFTGHVLPSVQRSGPARAAPPPTYTREISRSGTTWSAQ